MLAGKYELDRRLGTGGMAEAFLGRLIGKDAFSRPVAIKRVLAHLATDEAFVRMFVAEAQMCAKLQHPNIVSVLDFDRDEEGRPFLVLELVDGPSLADLANRGALPIDSTIHIATEILRGLAYAHDLPSGGGMRGIVHRDISPHNVLLSWEGTVKLADFGIAKARVASGVTASELLKGKPAYMSPEQANGEPLDARSDLFAVGIVLWELLTGRSLFSGNTTQETLARVLFAPVPSVRSIRPDVASDLDAVVTKLLARDKVDRYANATEAIAALVACKDSPRDGRGGFVALLAERFSTAARHGENLPFARTQDASPLPTPRDAVPAQSRTRALLLLVGALALTSVAVATTVIVLDRREPRSEPSPAPIALADPVVVDGPPSVDAAPALPVVDADTEPARVVDADIKPARVVDGRARANIVDASTPHDAASVSELTAALAADAGAVDPQDSVRAAARKKMVEDQDRTDYDRMVFPVPSLKAVKPEEVYTRARREAERLFGRVADAITFWVIRPDGTVDTSAHVLVIHFLPAQALDDGVKCLEVGVTQSEASVSLKQKECPQKGVRPRCTARQLHQRAVALGVSETATINAVLKGAEWEISNWHPSSNGPRDLLVPNDCGGSL
ncbi:MAG: serine/threonine protein kinase [Kofleriaceae bacterium]